MSFNMAEATARVTAQTEGQDKVTQLTGAMKDLSKQVKQFAADAGFGGNAAARMASEAQKAAGRTEGMAQASGLASHHMQNLAFQLNDVVVGLTSGQKPMTVFMQQGSQIGQIMAQANVGIMGLIKSVGSLVVGFLAANPLIAGLAAIAGVGAAAIGLMTAEINKSSKVHVTWKDTALGAYDVVKKYLTDELTAAFKYFGTTSGDVWKTVAQYTRNAVNFMIGAITLVPRALFASWSLIPSGIADIMISGVNYTIRAVNSMIAATVGAINGFIGAANGILGKAGLELPTISAPRLAELQNDFAGAGSKLGNALVNALTATWNYDYVGNFTEQVYDQAVKHALSDDKAKKHGKHAAKTAHESLVDELTQQAYANESKLNAWGEQFAKSVLKGIKDHADDIDGVRSDMARQAAARVKPAMEEAQRHYDSFGGGIDRAMAGYADSIGSVGERAFAAWKKAIHSTEDALVNFVMTGKLSFKDLANSIISDLVRIAIQEAIMKPLMAFLGVPYAKGGVLSGGAPSGAYANGAAFAGGQVQAFATGSVVSRPTLFPMAGGRTGLMGEAGPEAIMPLRRLPNGRLGVESSGGGGGTSVQVHVNASGSQVQGDGPSAGQLGRAIGQAVQAELIKQKRPGGLLAA